MFKPTVFVLSVAAAALVSSCAHEDPPPMRQEATGAAVSIKSEPSGNMRVQVRSYGTTSVQTQTPANVPPPPPPEKLPKRMQNSSDAKQFY